MNCALCETLFCLKRNRTIPGAEIMDFKIDFVGIGAVKAGSTWLADMLRQHPQIFLPQRKELHYFHKEFNEDPTLRNEHYNKPLRWYASFFENAKEGQLKGEFTPDYLWSENAARDIRNFNPKIKIIAILRNPIERTFSDYLYNIQRGIFSMSFKQAVKEKPFLIERSLYYEQLKRYFDLFPKKNIKVVFIDNDKESILRDVQKFLKVTEFIPKDVDMRVNVTGVSKYFFLNNIFSSSRFFLKKHNLNFALQAIRIAGIARISAKIRKDVVPFDSRPLLNEEIKKKLLVLFIADIEKLEKLLKKDLSHWKNV